MLRTAISNTSFPDWTLDRLCRSAAEWGCAGLDLRSFGTGGTLIASDPALTDPAKVNRLLANAGLALCAISTGVRFDKPVFPPVLGHILTSRDASIYEGRRAVDLARLTGAHGTRVYAYQGHGNERYTTLVDRIASRLRLVCDGARHDRAPVLLENGGSFPAAEDLLDLVGAVDHPQLALAYDVRAGLSAGDDPAEAITLLKDFVRLVRVRGDIELGVLESIVGALASEPATSECWVSIDWPTMWDDALAPAEQVLPEAIRRVASAAGAAASGARVA